MTRVLAIETSCDETAVAIVEEGRRVLCNLVATQFDLHAKYGGVVPELASRAHVEKLDLLVREAIKRCESANADGETGSDGPGSLLPAARRAARREAGEHPRDPKSADPDARALRGARFATPPIDAVAVTHRPGLIGALLIGVTGAKTLAWAWGKPLVAVDHIHAHAASAAMSTADDPWPAVSLVVSGGHTSLYLVRDYDDMELLGATTDDAAGEAFDKVAAILRLGYPGGPVIDRLARGGRPDAYDFPRAMLGADSLDFSFSGLKTAVLYAIHGPGRTSGGLERLTEQDRADLCASFQAAVADVLVRKTIRAAERTGVRTVCIGGGVAANGRLREELTAACARRGFRFEAADPRYCTDNAAMIGFLGHQLLRRGHTAPLDLTAATETELASNGRSVNPGGGTRGRIE